MEDRNLLLAEFAARFTSWTRALRELRAPDEAALRASLLAQGYPVVLISRSEHGFIYQAQAARFLISRRGSAEPGLLRQALDGRFGRVGWYSLYQEELWAGLEAQLALHLNAPVWENADKEGHNARRLHEEVYAVMQQAGFWQELHRRYGKDVSPPGWTHIVQTLFHDEMARMLGAQSLDSCWGMHNLAFRHVMRDIFPEHRRGPELGDWIEAARNGAISAFIWPGIAVVLCRPELHQDDQDRLHRDDGPSVSWPGPGGGRHYFWHGVEVPPKVVLSPQSLHSQDILSEKNSEVSRVMAERLGWERYMELAGAVLIDRWQDPDSSCVYELFGLKSRSRVRAFRLLKMRSPELQDGGRPFYVEPVPSQLKTCQAARRWQFRKPDGTWPSIEECNDAPALSFDIET